MVSMKSKTPKFRPLAEQLEESFADILAGRVSPMDFSDIEEKKTSRKVASKNR